MHSTKTSRHMPAHADACTKAWYHALTVDELLAEVADTSSTHTCRWLIQAAGIREQHPFEVCLLCSHSQLAKGTVQHTPDVLGKVCVWCDVTPPQVIQKLHASTTGETKKRTDYAFRQQYDEKPCVIPGCPRVPLVSMPEV